MKCWVICQYYSPEIGAPQARLSEMVKTWVKEGHDITVLTGFPNHPSGIIPEAYRGKRFQVEQGTHGETIWRHWLYATPNKGFFKKVLSHLSFMVTLILFSLFRKPKPDHIMVSSPAFFCVISTYLISRLRKVPYTFEVRDLWPGIFVELGVLKNRVIITILEKIECFLYHKAKTVVAVTDGFKQDMERRGIPKDKIELSKSSDELNIRIGNHRRNLVLPQALATLQPSGAKIEDDFLKIRFDTGVAA